LLIWGVLLDNCCSQSVYKVYYVVLNDGLPLDIRLIDLIDAQQLMEALGRSNTTLQYSSYLYTGPVDELIAFKSLLLLPFKLAVATSSYAAIERVTELFYQTRYPGLHFGCRFRHVGRVSSRIGMKLSSVRLSVCDVHPSVCL